MATASWFFDTLDQQLFILFRQTALEHLMPAGTSPTVIKSYAGYSASVFVMGWALGGLIFGSLGDRYGRARMLTVTVLLYSVFTGLSALSQGWIDFAIYRFITGLGVGGVFGLAVALIADSLPDHSRPGALGSLQAISGIGNISAALISMGIGQLIRSGTLSADIAWKLAFLIGALPAFLCVFIQLRLREPEKWLKARASRRPDGTQLGSYFSLLGMPRWRRPALLGMVLCIAGVVGLWGVGFFSFELVSDVITNSLREQGMTGKAIQGAAQFWKSINGIVFNGGAFLGMLSLTYLAQAAGRKPAFVVAFSGALISTLAYFTWFNGVGSVWMSAVMGFFQLGLFACFAIYLPELFPTQLRSTGTSFCYNVGRFLAASGPFTLGMLQEAMAKGVSDTAEKLAAFRHACQWMSLIFLLGLLMLFFLPETKGQPLPEDPEPSDEPKQSDKKPLTIH